MKTILFCMCFVAGSVLAGKIDDSGLSGEILSQKNRPPEEFPSVTQQPERKLPKTVPTDQDGVAGGATPKGKVLLETKYEADIQRWERGIARLKERAAKTKDTELRQRQIDTADLMEKKVARFRRNVEELGVTANAQQEHLLSKTIQKDRAEIISVFGSSGFAE